MPELSKDQQEYLHQIKRHKYWVLVTQVSMLLLLLFAWEFSVEKGFLNGFIFSSPGRVISCFYAMVKDQSLFYHIGITLLETFASFGIIVVLTFGVSILLWWFPTLSDILEPYFVVLNSLPKSALAPILIVWLGNDMKTIIVTAISIAVFGSILNLYQGFVGVNPERIILVQTLGGSRFDCLRLAVIPSCISLFISLMKVSIGLCLVGVVIGEFLAAKAGLGYLIIYSSQVFKMDQVVLSIIILCVIAMFLYKLLHIFELIYDKS